jgi:hypothetical protein
MKAEFKGKLTEDRYPRCPDCGHAVVGAAMTSKSFIVSEKTVGDLQKERYYHPDALSVYCQHCNYDQPFGELRNDPPDKPTDKEEG